MKQAALLLRCSTDSQDYDRQQKDLLPTAKNLGYEVTKDLIFGEYVTGKDDVRKKDRESIVNLKQACKEGKVDAIFINEVSRLSRDSIAGRLFVREFNEQYKVPIFFRDLQQWTIAPETKIKNTYLEQMLGFHFDVAATELKSMKTRFASGKRKNARTGKSIGGVPSIGYTKDNEGTIIIDEEAAKLIKIIFDKYLEKEGTITTVCRYLRGISSIRAWGTGTIGNILRNRAYTGKMEVSITNPDEQDENKRVEKYITTIPIIIEEDTFNKVQKKLDKNRSTQEYTRSKVHLLQKLIKCSDCGKLFSAKTVSSGKSTAYCCVSKQNGINCNLSIALDANKVESIIWNLVKSKLMELNRLGEDEKIKRITAEKIQIQSYIEEITGLELGINKLIKRRNNLISYIENAETEEEIAEIKDRRKKLDKEVNDNKERINHLKKNIEICESNINNHLNNSYTSSILESIESDRNKLKKQIKEFVREILPYPIANSHSVLKVNTTFGIYYILYSSRDKDKQAYYIQDMYAKFFPTDKKFLIIGDKTEIPMCDKISSLARVARTTTDEKEKEEMYRQIEELEPQKIKYPQKETASLKDIYQLNTEYFNNILKKLDQIGIYTYDEMKEMCKSMGFILPFN